MFIIIPVRPTIRVMPVVVLMGLLFVAGIFLGTTACWLFTAPALLDRTRLWMIPVALITGVVLFGLARQSFKGASEGDSEGGFFAMRGLSAAVVLVLALLALAGGIWLGLFAAKDERQFRLTQLHNSTPTSRAAARTEHGTNIVAARVAAQPLRLQAIFYNATRPSAILNGKTVVVGDEVAGYRVVAIRPTDVTVENTNGDARTLSLK